LPLVVTLQGETMMDDSDIFEKSWTLRTALRRGIRSAAVVTGCSSFTLADAERRFGLTPDGGVVIVNGVDVAGAHSGTATHHDGHPSAPPEPPGLGDPPTQPPPSAALDLPERPYVLALGRVVGKKGFDLLLAAYAATDRARDSVDLVIGGAGSALGDLRALADELGLADRVHFPGRLNRQQVGTVMAGAEVFVMPSRLEPFGIVVLEGWRAGVATMATTRGGPPEFVRDGVDGVLIDPFDTAGFAAALEQVVTDDDLRHSLAAAGAARVEEFAWPVVADRYRAVYESVVGAGSASAPVDRGLRVPKQGESVP
jgi:glycogen(starch) synthase